MGKEIKTIDGLTPYDMAMLFLMYCKRKDIEGTPAALATFINQKLYKNFIRQLQK